jgi:uncharacterized protein
MTQSTSANFHLESARIYAQTRSKFIQFIQNKSVHRNFWESVLAEAVPLKELPDDDFISEELIILKTATHTTEAIHSKQIRTRSQWVGGQLVLTITSPSEELWDFSETLLQNERSALDVFLRRAFFPFDALITYPLETLFSTEEVAWLTDRPRCHDPVIRTELDWQSGQSILYTGYICAITKFTRLCNLRCTYCHDWRSEAHQTMSFKVQARLFEQLFQPDSHSQIDVIWHGGEPTLIGRRNVLRILMLQRWFARPGQRVSNLLQTNATTLDADWIRLLSRYRFQVSFSLDGPPEVHDRTRVYPNGSKTFAHVQQGLKLLKQANLLSGVLLVASSALRTIGAPAIIQFLQAEQLTAVGVLPLRPGLTPPSNDEPYLDRATYFQFLQELENARLNQPTPWIQIRELDTLKLSLRNQIPNHCEMLGNCIGSFFGIEPTGEVYHCDKFIGDFQYILGNILEQDFDQMRHSPQAQQLKTQNQIDIAALQGCPYFKYCQGWCPHERYLAKQYESNSETCCGLSELFEAFRGDYVAVSKH